MIKRIVLTLLLALSAVRADALEYTDVWFNPAESGWGMFAVQSEQFQFIALFIYGADGKPTWFTANITQNGASYTGPLFATTGTYYAIPWTGVGLSQVGTLTFTPVDFYHATLSYTVNGVATVNKTIQRQTLTSRDMAGSFFGSMAGSISGCANPANNDAAFRARWSLQSTQVADDSITLAFTFVDTAHNGQTCTVSGPLTHYGRQYRMANAATTCTGPVGGTFAVTVEQLHPTGQGIEGKWSGPAAGGCTVSYHFMGVQASNN
jgi:hypothetical protein